MTYDNCLNNEFINDFTQLQGRVVFTELGSVQRLFYSEIEKGSIYNSRIKTPKGSIVALTNVWGLIYKRKSKHRGCFAYYW